uniref:Uncharacterized protein n=1 Tax=Lepeophtheirus salmonis TaxID=72036 RepID=A0A0K2V0W4_LEPSM
MNPKGVTSGTYISRSLSFFFDSLKSP